MHQQKAYFIGPTVPPNLLSLDGISDEEKIIGPILPHIGENLKYKKPAGICSTMTNIAYNNHLNIGPSLSSIIQANVSENEEDYVIGPMPSSSNDKQKSVIEDIEERARKMKDKLNFKHRSDPETMQREMWMLELPPKISKNFGLTERKFRKNAAPQNIDRSLWTETPLEKSRREQLGLEVSSLKPSKDRSLEMVTAVKNKTYMKEVEEYNCFFMMVLWYIRPLRQYDNVAYHQKLKKRKKSLMELHQEQLHGKKVKSTKEAMSPLDSSQSDSSSVITDKKRKKKDKKKHKKSHRSKNSSDSRKDHKSKNSLVSGNSVMSKNKLSMPERRPFDRDIDLKANRFDDAQRQRLIKKSQVLNSKFGHGNSHFL